MRLGRIRHEGQVLGIEGEGEDRGRVLDVGGTDPLQALLDRAARRDGDAGKALVDVATASRTGRIVTFAPDDLLAPLARPGKVLAIGLNYVDHTAETRLRAPESPLVFAKHATSIAGPYDDIRAPRSQTQQLDYEGELCVVMGRHREPDGSAGPADVAAYTAGNDVSARDVQFGDVQWTRGKSFDTFAPIGPWLVTSDELGDVSDIRIRTLVNGEVVQDDVAGSMVFGVAEILAHLSAGTTFEPGDLVMTGTPAGAGAFQDPPRFLSDGDVVEVIVDRIGTLRNVVRDA